MHFEKRKLKNGITVLYEKRDLPVVCYSITNPFGGAYEESDIKGAAHLFEHLLFTGTKTRTNEEISGEIEKRGGVVNAYTAQEATTYWCKVPSEHLERAMNVLHDMLNNPTFEKEKFEKEKKVVCEEIKMYHDDPERHVYEMIESAMYEKPFSEGILGSSKTVQKMTKNKIEEIFASNYSPEKYIVLIIGQADFEKVCSQIERDFKPSKKNHLNKIKEIKLKNEEIKEEREGITQSQLIIGMHAPLDPTKQYALELLNAYLAGGMSSKLWLEIREKRGLAYTVRGSIEKEKSYSYYTIYVGTTKEAINEVKKIIFEEIRKVEEITEKEVEEIKERVVGLRKISTEESINTMQKISMLEVSTGKGEDYYKYEQNIKKININDIKNIAKEISKKYSIAIITPK